MNARMSRMATTVSITLVLPQNTVIVTGSKWVSPACITAKGGVTPRNTSNCYVRDGRAASLRCVGCSTAQSLSRCIA